MCAWFDEAAEAASLGVGLRSARLRLVAWYGLIPTCLPIEDWESRLYLLATGVCLAGTIISLAGVFAYLSAARLASALAKTLCFGFLAVEFRATSTVVLDSFFWYDVATYEFRF